MNEKGQVEKIIPSPFERGFDSLAARLLPVVPMSMTPNCITSIGLITGLAAAAGFYLAGIDRRFFFLAAIGIFIHLLADSLDGAVARERNARSDRGHYYDQISDIVVAVATFLAMGFSSYGSLEIMIWPALIYPLNMVIILHWINLKGKWPFPRFGPFEMYFLVIAFAIIGFTIHNPLFSVFGSKLSIFDIAVLIVLPFGYLESISSAVKLFKELD